ncbi:MAG: NrdH-redoxin [Renibacterium salmoninarum]|jgi:glutaredoxin-like protein NrdH|nr:NrdH-redoxin [Renibacterium salmoninarum]
MEIIVWSKRDTYCGDCAATLRILRAKKIPHRVEYLEANPAQIELFRSQNLLKAPVVMAGEDSWSGFRIDKLAQLSDLYWGTGSQTAN